MVDMENKLHWGTNCMDCLEGLKLMKDNSVDLVVTSPPYDNLREYKEGHEFDFEGIAKELYRVIKDGGIIVWIVGDKTEKGSETGTSFKQALYFKEIGFNLHDTMIYHTDKLPLNHNRYEQEFEYMFILSKGKPNIFNPIRIPCKYSDSNHSNASFRQEGADLRPLHNLGKVKKNKIKGNIWYCPSGFQKSSKDKIAYKHPAIFPEQLANDHIISWSNENDIIMDIFSGSGTTHKMALLNNRRFIGFELSQEYVDIEEQRLKDCGLWCYDENYNIIKE